ncbi:Tumor protein p63-regulated protein 1 protein, variant 3 [Clonorchis sinensis]|uniref:Tumor protein p63-regulated protein 1 protein, variant 3 n=1 Tax=Clonorchis sinensis TaxID=79923 RepID=A0A8T1LYD7_CLOSI|nr:Tumor protein p63-regulated protein 1 protein, variant 3 [Clonorchis sinensis]
MRPNLTTCHEKSSVIAPYWCIDAMQPEGRTKSRVPQGCPSIDRGSREAEVGFEPQTIRFMQMAARSASRDRGRKLYIGGLPQDVVKDDLLHELNKYGEVVDVWIARNPPGFAFVEYVTAGDAEKAVRALDGVNLCGSHVRVEFARAGRSKKPLGSNARGSRSLGRGPPRRYESPRRSGRYSPPFEGSRYPYDQLAPFYPDVATAAAAAAAISADSTKGYAPMLPFLPPEELLRSLQPPRRSLGRTPPSVYPRGRSPGLRRRSRSPLESGGRSRGRSSSITYDGRSRDRRFDPQGRSFNDVPRSRGQRETSVGQPSTEVIGDLPVKDNTDTGQNELNRPPTTPDGKIWPAGVRIHSEGYFCVKFDRERVQSLVRQHCVQQSDGNLLGVWILTRIDHWDNDQECTVCLTDQVLMLISLNFITEKIVWVQRIPLSNIHTIRLGNLMSPQWSVLPHRNFGAVQLIWGPLANASWKERWNPLSREIPAATLHHHPCFYAHELLKDKDMYDCDTLVTHLTVMLEPVAVQVPFVESSAPGP